MASVFLRELLPKGSATFVSAMLLRCRIGRQSQRVATVGNAPHVGALSTQQIHELSCLDSSRDFLAPTLWAWLRVHWKRLHPQQKVRLFDLRQIRPASTSAATKSRPYRREISLLVSQPQVPGVARSGDERHSADGCTLKV